MTLRYIVTHNDYTPNERNLMALSITITAEADMKLNRAVKENPNMLEEIFFEYVAACQGFDEEKKQALLTDLLAAQYRAIVYGNM